MIHAAVIAVSLHAASPRKLPSARPGCARGEILEHTSDPYEPFRCVPAPKGRLGDLGESAAPPACPEGRIAEPTPGKKERFRCVANKRPNPEPDIAPSPAADAPPPPTAAKGPSVPKSYARYVVKGRFSVDYPSGWRVTDAWRDEEPTLYFEFDTGRSGKQVSLVITRASARQAGFMTLDVAVEKEKQWRNAAESPSRMVSGRRARATYVENDSRSAFVPFGVDGGYYTLSFSAPEDSFAALEPAYERLLNSFRLEER